MFKEIFITILPFWFLFNAIIDLILCGAYAMGYTSEQHKGISYSIISLIQGIANLFIALIFLFNL